MNRDIVKVSEATVIVAFSLLRQAERSLDHGLNSPREKILEFYAGRRLSRLEHFLEHVTKTYPCASVYKIDSDKLLDYIREWAKPTILSYFRIPFARKMYRFRSVEMCAIGCVLSQWLRSFTVEKPADSELVRLRMQMSYLEDMIFNRCTGLTVLNVALKVENYNQPDQISHLSIEEILKTAGIESDGV